VILNANRLNGSKCLSPEIQDYQI